MTDTIQPKDNGNGEQARREQEFASWLAKQSTERDDFAKEVSWLKQRIAEMEAIEKLQNTFITTLESRCASAYAVRDQAVAEAEKHKATNSAALAVLRAAEVPNVPLVREIPEEEPAIGGA